MISVRGKRLKRTDSFHLFLDKFSLTTFSLWEFWSYFLESIHPPLAPFVSRNPNRTRGILSAILSLSLHLSSSGRRASSVLVLYCVALLSWRKKEVGVSFYCVLFIALLLWTPISVFFSWSVLRCDAWHFDPLDWTRLGGIEGFLCICGCFDVLGFDLIVRPRFGFSLDFVFGCFFWCGVGHYACFSSDACDLV